MGNSNIIRTTGEAAKMESNLIYRISKKPVFLGEPSFRLME